MAADPVEPRRDRHGSIPVAMNDGTQQLSVGFDATLDPAVRKLFEQQAEIQAKLAALLPAKYVPNGKFETDMLRLKLRALETFTESQSRCPYGPLDDPPNYSYRN
jgi:hypothetical protein